MIATITNHISKGVQNYNDTSKKMTWFKTNFNMPVPNYMASNSPFTRYSGCWNYLTETTSYSLTGFVPGYEICNGCAIFDFENDGGSTYNIDTYLYVDWKDPSLNLIYWIINGYHLVYSLPAGTYTEVWQAGNIGCAGWEVSASGNYHFRASASGTPNISVVDTTVAMSNVPSTSLLGSGTEGYIWVEGNDLCYVNANQWKHTIVGTYVNNTPGVTKAGYFWLGSDDLLHWVGSDGNDYKISWSVKQYASFYFNGPTGTTYAGTGNVGKIWVDNEFGETHLAFIASDGYKYLTGAGDNPYA